MTAYTAIPDSDIDPESPGTTTLFTRLRDNPIAITEGSVGAPSISSAALADYPFSNASGDISDGGWVFLESWTPTATNSNDFTIDETVYSAIKVVIDDISPATNGALLYLRFGYSDGASFITTGYKYSIAETGADTAFSVASSISQIPLTVAGIGANDGEGISSTIEIQHLLANGSSRGVPAMASFNSSVADQGALERSYQGSGLSESSSIQDIDSVRLFWSSGNFKTKGKIYIYGLKRG